VLGFGALALAQSDQPGDRATARSGTVSSMTTPQVAALMKNTKHSLADSVATAERHCNGRAVRAECWRGADAGPICVITLLVGDNRLVEATVNTQSGEIVSQRDVNTLRFVGVIHDGAADSSDFALARRWQKATDLMGKKVANAAGEDLGQIKDIVVDPSSGRILYGVLSFGGLLGLGDKLFAIPWPSVRLADDGKAFVLHIEKDRLKNADGFAKDRWPDFADEQFATATYAYYDQTPYWRSEAGRDVQLAADSRSGARDSYRHRWNLRTTAWQKTSDLCGKKVRSVQTDDIGKLSDLAIDPDTGRILYGILSFRGKLFAIPWSALSLNSEAKHFVLNTDKERLTDAVSFSNDQWPNLVEPQWAADTYTHYNVEPFWDGPTPQPGDHP
jgi:sporulation protein YlmC with PRC-barrel domain